MSERKGESFADLFARGAVPIAKTRRLTVGDKVEGVIGHVGPDAVFVDLDDKQQGYFDSIELRDHEGKPSVAVGERIEGYVLDTSGGQIKLGRRFGREGGSGAERFKTALDQGVPVEGKVTGINKGGAEVDLGGVRAFCPVSQLDDRYVEDANAFVGRTLTFLVTKVGDRDVVLSRKALLLREAKSAKEKTLATLAIGSVVKGAVKQVRDFGAFVDLGGIEGLIPARELSHDRVRPDEVVHVGDVVEVQVKAIESKGEKTEITLSLKALTTDPWTAIETLAPKGRVLAGQVSRVSEFGAFVRVAQGIEGLLHISELGARVKRPEDVLEVGQPLLVRVTSIDADKKRLGLALASEGASAGGQESGPAFVLGAIVEVEVEKVENFGVLVQLVGSKGRAGRAVIPNAETGVRIGGDLRKEFPAGKKLTAKVIEAGDRRVRVSVKAAAADAERADFDSYRAGQAGKGMGTLGDLLKKSAR